MLIVFFFCKQYAYLPVSLSDRVRISARSCRDKRTRRGVEGVGVGGGVIVLLNARSPLRLGGRWRRLAGLQRSEVVWEQLLPPDRKKREEDSFPSLVDLCKSYMKKRPRRKGHTLCTTRAHSQSIGVEPQKSFFFSPPPRFVCVFFLFFDTPTHDVGGREERGKKTARVGRWKEMFGSRSVQHGVQLVCQVVKHAADVVQDGDGGFFAGERAGRVTVEERERESVAVNDRGTRDR